MEPSFAISPKSPRKLLFKCNSSILYQTDLDSIEPLSQETFFELVKNFSSNGKKSILAVVRSRDNEHLDQFYSFFFNAYQLNKLLFKSRASRELISRHDRFHPFSVVNPLTNTLIVGEVEYFIVDPYSRQGKNEDLDQDVVEAQLIGTDLNYVSSESLREVFKANALRSEDLAFPVFQGIYQELDDAIQINVNAEELRRDLEDNRDQLLAQVRVPFRKAVFFGIVFVFFNATLGIILVMAGKKFIAASGGRLSRFNASEICQICCLACICFIFDRYVQKLFKEKEDRSILHSKIISWVCLGGAIGLTFTTSSLVIMMSCSGMLLGFTVFYHISALTLFVVFHTRKRLV